MEFETKLKRLEEIVQGIEAGDIPLEKSLTLFEEGVRLSRECHVQLNRAEQKVQELMSVQPDGMAVTKDLRAE